MTNFQYAAEESLECWQVAEAGSSAPKAWGFAIPAAVPCCQQQIMDLRVC